MRYKRKAFTACFHWLFVITFFLALSCTPAMDGAGISSVDKDAVGGKNDALIVEGKVKKTSSEAKTISLTVKDDVLAFKVTDRTVFGNAASLKDFKADEEVRVEYTQAGEERIAISIGKVMARIPEGVAEIKTAELHGLVSGSVQGGKDFLVIDSRPAKKYQEAHIPGAVSIPFSELKEKGAALLPAERSIHLIFYCGGPT